MSTDLFRRSGKALYGPNWQKPLAEHFDVSVRTMRRWANGHTPIPEDVRRNITNLVESLSYDIEDLLNDLRSNRLYCK